MTRHESFDTVTTKTKPWADVTAYGAVGDGTTDDTAAIHDAISSGVDRVYVPGGDYVITQPITLPAGVTILGDGSRASTLLFQGVNGFQTDARTDHWTLRDLRIEDAQNGADTIGVDVRDYSSYYSVHGCLIENFGKHGFHHSGLAWTVSDCRFRGNGSNTTDTPASIRLSDRVDVPTTGQYDQIYLQNGAEYGFLLQSVRQIFLNNCIGEYHTVAFRAENCNSVFVDGFWPEQNDATDPVQAHDSNVFWKGDVGPSPEHTWSAVAQDRRYPTGIGRLDIQFRDVTAGRELHAPENPSITPVIETVEDTAANQTISHTFSSIPADADKVILQGTYSRTASGFGELQVTLNGTTTADYQSLDKDGTENTRAYWPVVRVGQETSGVPFRVEIGTDDATVSAESGGVDPQATQSGYLAPVSGLSSIEITSGGDTYADGTMHCGLFEYRPATSE